MTDFKKLKVWQKSHMMALDAHRLAGRIRGTTHSSLKSQLIRAAMSVPMNIVEGSGQQSSREFARFLRIALNSTTELESRLTMILQRLNAVPLYPRICEVLG